MNKKLLLISSIFLSAQPNPQNSSKTEVYMWNQRTISFMPNETGAKSIFTNGLGGCIALALAVRCATGERFVGMSHYPPISRSEQVNGLKRMWSQFQDKCNGDIAEKQLIIAVPGEWEKDNTGKWEMIPKASEQNHITNLRGAASINNPTVTSYPESRSLEKSYDPDFEIIMTPHSTQWQCFGTWHILKDVFDNCTK